MKIFKNIIKTIILKYKHLGHGQPATEVTWDCGSDRRTGRT